MTNEFVVKGYLSLSKRGSLGSADSQVNRPFGVAVNPSTGSEFMADQGNNHIQVLDSTGNFITIFGTAGSANGQFNGPAGVAVNPTTGNVYVSDSDNNRIRVFPGPLPAIRQTGTR